MNTSTPRTYAAKTKSGFAAVPDQFYEFARTLETELSALRAEVERLRSDRDCEKRLRKDADEFRENATERAQRAEADLASERGRLDYLSTRGFEHRHHETGDHLGYEWTISSYSESEDVTLRDVIDAEMREDEK